MKSLNNYTNIITERKFPMKGREHKMMTKEQYTEKITELLNNCDNMAVIDLIYQLLQKAQ